MTRPPVVLGLGSRVGAGTVAAALHATEPQPVATDVVDIAVCAGDEPSLRRAESAPRAEVLLVVLIDGGPPPTRARQQALQRRHGQVVVLPYVPRWAGLARPPDDAAALLTQPPEQTALRAYAEGLRLAVAALLGSGALSRPRRAARAASTPTARAVQVVHPTPATTHPGAPLPSAPPTSARGAPTTPRADRHPHTAQPTPTTLTSARGVPTALRADRHPPAVRPSPATPTSPLVLDDDALEAEVLAAPVRVPGAPGVQLRTRARHRPVVRPARVAPAKAG